ncbi:hypothetical protein BGW80DRAFT_833084 [Lactifluus volemus]|nr:hypothetical protein BGW80DRAFT_833084 [Lactifluus volemus]
MSSLPASTEDHSRVHFVGESSLHDVLDATVTVKPSHRSPTVNVETSLITRGPTDKAPTIEPASNSELGPSSRTGSLYPYLTYLFPCRLLVAILKPTKVSELSLTFHYHHPRAQLPATLLFLSPPRSRRLFLPHRPREPLFRTQARHRMTEHSITIIGLGLKLPLTRISQSNHACPSLT